MTKKDLCIKAGILNEDGSYIPGKMFDYALPQGWLNDINKIVGAECVSDFVWLYDNKSFYGRPFSITKRGWEFLKKYNKEMKAYWPIEECSYSEGQLTTITYKKSGISIQSMDFHMSGSNQLLYRIAKLLDENCIPETKTENVNSYQRFVSFEIEKEKFEKLFQ